MVKKRFPILKLPYETIAQVFSNVDDIRTLVVIAQSL